MEIKISPQGLLIYATMACYVLAFGATMLKRRKAHQGLFVAGFACGLVSWLYRWTVVGHVPMQNLFEVFLTMGMIIYPLSLLCRRGLKVGGEAFDLIIGALVLFPAGFIFAETPRQLPPALQCWVFAPHVAVYVLGYILMGKATVQAAAGLLGREQTDPALADRERSTYRMITLGFPLMTLGLILGSWWGHLAWGHYWGWDPKELWSLVTWLVYLGYFHFRSLYGRKYAKVNHWLAVIGMICVIITLLWANLSHLFSGMHSYAF